MENDIICFNKKKIEDRIIEIDKFLESEEMDRDTYNIGFIEGERLTLSKLLETGFSGEEIFEAGRVYGMDQESAIYWAEAIKEPSYQDYLKSKGI